MAKSKTKKINTKKQLRKKRRRGFVAFLICLLVFSAIAYAARFMLIDCVKISSDAMSPDYKTGDVVIVSKLSAWQANDYEKGQTVCARFTAAGEGCLLRKVAGVPGDYIEDRDGEFYLLSGEDEVYLGACTGLVNGTIPDGAYLLLRAENETGPDGRTLGLVYKTDITGTPCAVIWPIGRIGGR